MKLDEAADFIRKRFKKYSGPKGGDRLFFNDELIQFLAHQAGVRHVDDDDAD